MKLRLTVKSSLIVESVAWSLINISLDTFMNTSSIRVRVKGIVWIFELPTVEGGQCAPGLEMQKE